MAWPRDGAEVIRVKAGRPAYWKAARWRTSTGRLGRRAPTRRRRRARAWPAGLGDAAARPGRESRSSVQRMRGTDVIGAGTTAGISESRGGRARHRPGQWEAIGDLRSGDSYKLQVFVPRPDGGAALAAIDRGDDRHEAGRPAELELPLRRGKAVERPRSPIDGGLPRARGQFAPFGRWAADRRRCIASTGRSRTLDRAPALRSLAHVGPAERLQAQSRDALRLRARGQQLPAQRVHLHREPAAAAAGRVTARVLPVRHQGRATASTTRRRWRCCCAWAGSRRASRPASARAATPSASRRGSCATPTRIPGSRRGSTATAGSPSTRRPPPPRRARRSPPLMEDHGGGGSRLRPRPDRSAGRPGRLRPTAQRAARRTLRYDLLR